MTPKPDRAIRLICAITAMAGRYASACTDVADVIASGAGLDSEAYLRARRARSRRNRAMHRLTDAAIRAVPR